MAFDGIVLKQVITEKEMDKHVYKKTSIERVHPEGRRLSYEIADKIKDKLEANDMKAAIRKGYSNKAKVQEDGITYIPDTKQEYPLYQLQITKAYYNMEKEAVIVSIIEELKTIITELEQLRDEKKKEEIER